jgi:hypothetical protein
MVSGLSWVHSVLYSYRINTIDAVHAAMDYLFIQPAVIHCRLQHWAQPLGLGPRPAAWYHAYRLPHVPVCCCSAAAWRPC